MIYTHVAVYMAPDSYDGQKTCLKHVKFYSKNKFEKLVHLIGFIIIIYHHARSSECLLQHNLCFLSYNMSFILKLFLSHVIVFTDHVLKLNTHPIG